MPTFKDKITSELKQCSNKKQANISQRFFKTGKGEYGEGDIFIGVTVPVQRKISKKYVDIDINELQTLIKSSIHEERLTSLLILILKFNKRNKSEQQRIFNFYIKYRKYINNWDLIDISAHKIVGAYLEGKDKDILLKYAKTGSLWERRIAIISTFWYIKQNFFKDTLQIARILVNDKHDLIQKAVGWMLREIGNRDIITEETFLIKYYKEMPRTMLRYAIEKFPEVKRKKYLKGEIN